MTPHEYQSAVIANRLFGRLQVRAHTRQLAAEYGVPEEALDGPMPSAPAKPLWLAPEIPAEDRLLPYRLRWHYGMQVQHPDAYMTVASIAASVA